MDPTTISGCNLWLKSGVGMYDATTGGSAVVDGGKVLRWEDQTGTGNHVTQATMANQCVYDSSHGGVVVSEQGADQKFSLPAGYSIDARAFSAFFIVETSNLRKPYDGAANDDYHFYLESTGNVVDLYFAAADGKLSVRTGAGILISTGLPLTSRALIGFVCSATNAVVYVNGTAYTVATAPTAGTSTGGVLFGDAGASKLPGQGRYSDVMLYNRAVSAQDASDLLTYARTRGIVESSGVAANFVTDGDSITYGYGSTKGLNWERQMGASPARLVRNVAESAKFISALKTEAASRVDPLIVSGKTNVVALFAGTNDALNAGTSTQIYNDTVTYGTDRKTAGWNKVIVVGMLPRSTGTHETNRQAVRTAMLADFSVATAYTNVWAAGPGITYADYYIDMGADTTIGQIGQQTNTTYYLDGTHPTTAGYAIIASYTTQAFLLAVPLMASVHATPALLHSFASGFRF